MKSKTIILSSPLTNGRGILTIYNEDELLKCKIRLYNVSKLNRFCKLGIYHNKEVFSANLLEKEGVYFSSMVGNFDMDNDFYCAIINTENENNVILSGGTYSGYFFNEEDNIENKFKTIEKENPNTNLYDYNEETIDKKLEEVCSEDCEKCKNCKYKQWFYVEQNQEKIEKEEPITTNLENLQNQNTIDEEIKNRNIPSLIDQFKNIFENYPEDNVLNNLIQNSKFVKINENNTNYSIGAIYENNEMKYICYAVMCNYNTPAPNEIGEHYQWLPLDNEDPLSEGYYIVFQDVNDLKIVEL